MAVRDLWLNNTHTHNAPFCFHCNDGYANAPNCYTYNVAFAEYELLIRNCKESMNVYAVIEGRNAHRQKADEDMIVLQ